MTTTMREVKLIFANYENAPKPLITISTEATVKDLKLELLSVWPQEDVPLCEDLARIRLICSLFCRVISVLSVNLGMGSGILQDSHLIGSYIAELPYPTPVNVSIRPDGFEASKNTKSAVALPSTPQTTRSRDSNGHHAHVVTSRNCGCAIS